MFETVVPRGWKATNFLSVIKKQSRKHAQVYYRAKVYTYVYETCIFSYFINHPNSFNETISGIMNHTWSTFSSRHDDIHISLSVSVHLPFLDSSARTTHPRERPLTLRCDSTTISTAPPLFLPSRPPRSHVNNSSPKNSLPLQPPDDIGVHRGTRVSHRASKRPNRWNKQIKKGGVILKRAPA